MGFFNDTFGNNKQQNTADGPAKKNPVVDPDKPFKLKGEAEHTGPKQTPQSVLDWLEFIAYSSPETRAKTQQLSEDMKSEELIFHRVFVKKDAPEGDYFADEDQALEKWGADGYTSVFRLVSSDGKRLERVATKDEHEKLVKLESARKRKQREAADKAKKDSK